jgi:hypothetical protein
MQQYQKVVHAEQIYEFPYNLCQGSLTLDGDLLRRLAIEIKTLANVISMETLLEGIVVTI